MSFSKKPLAFMLSLVILTPVEASAQAVAPATPTGGSVAEVGATPSGANSMEVNAPAPLTLKERLGAKWKDEQRVDNCKVPLEKRGPKPRPDSCVHRPMN